MITAAAALALVVAMLVFALVAPEVNRMRFARRPGASIWDSDFR